MRTVAIRTIMLIAMNVKGHLCTLLPWNSTCKTQLPTRSKVRAKKRLMMTSQSNAPTATALLELLGHYMLTAVTERTMPIVLCAKGCLETLLPCNSICKILLPTSILTMRPKVKRSTMMTNPLNVPVVTATLAPLRHCTPIVVIGKIMHIVSSAKGCSGTLLPCNSINKTQLLTETLTTNLKARAKTPMNRSSVLIATATSGLLKPCTLTAVTEKIIHTVLSVKGYLCTMLPCSSIYKTYPSIKARMTRAKVRVKRNSTTNLHSVTPAVDRLLIGKVYTNTSLLTPDTTGVLYAHAISPVLRSCNSIHFHASTSLATSIVPSVPRHLRSLPP